MMNEQDKPNNFIDAMRMPATDPEHCNLIAVHPNNSELYRYDKFQRGFVALDLGQHTINLFKIQPFNKTKEDKRSWGNIRCIERSERTLIIILVLGNFTNKVFLAVYELKKKESTAQLIEEYKIRGVERICSKSERKLINDENGDLYYVDCCSDSEQQETTFSVARFTIGPNAKVSHHILARKQLLDNYCLFQVPFIYKGNINFIVLDLTVEAKEIISVQLEFDAQENNPEGAKKDAQNLRKQYLSIAPDFNLPKNDSLRQYPQFGHGFSPQCFQNGNDTVFAYVRTNGNTGELWSLDLKSKRWNRCFKLLSHDLMGYCTIFVTSEYRLFLRGICADEECQGKGHLYHFGIPLRGHGSEIRISEFPKNGKFLYPEIRLLEAIFARSKKQIYYGPEGSGKLVILSLKAVLAFQSVEDKNMIKVFVSSETQRTIFSKNFFFFRGNVFNRKNIFLLSEASFDSKDFINCEIFVLIDEFSSLSFDQKKHLMQRSGNATILLNTDGSLPYGFDHPRLEAFSWHRLEARKEYNHNIIKYDDTFQNKNENMHVNLKNSMEAMNHFYSKWWSTILPERTICIPESQDISKNRYLRATDKHAKGYCQKYAKEKEHLYRGQKAENDFIAIFQNLNISGVLISGFDSMEFAKSWKCHGIFKKLRIGAFEVDAIFFHPMCGIFVFEIKATEKEKYVELTMEKGIAQLEKIKQTLPILFHFVCKTSLNVPVYYVLCYPNIKLIPEIQYVNDKIILSQSYFEDEKKVKNFIFSQLDEQRLDPNAVDSLKAFTAYLAGYRSTDYISIGHNALAVHKMIDTQNFENKKHEEGGIFLTKEQLTILECRHRCQIISGPPGTGKTLILLRKALCAAQRDEKGKVHVICGRPELQLKFKIFFEKHNTLRFPRIHNGFASVHSYCDEDDVFADEQYLNALHSVEIHKRLKHSGQTIIVVTGALNALEVKDAEEYLKKNQLAEFTHFPMNTVIRSSQKIFNEWVPEFRQINYHVYLGHNIAGHSVHRKTLLNSTKTLEYLRDQIYELFELPNSPVTKQKISLAALCIITDHEQSCQHIKHFLSSNLVPCGSVEEQHIHQNIAAVAEYEETVSHEWPIVILVSFLGMSFDPNFFLIAASRGIAKLIIIETDYSNIFMKIDRKIQPQQQSETLPLLQYSKFAGAVESAALENEESLKFIIDHYYPFQLIYMNGFFKELNETHSIFDHCDSLYNSWKLIAKHRSFCRVMLRRYGCLRKNMNITLERKHFLSEKPSLLFTWLTSKKLTVVERERHWETLRQLQISFIEILEEEKNGYQTSESERIEQKHIFQQLRKAGAAWKWVELTIFTILG